MTEPAGPRVTSSAIIRPQDFNTSGDPRSRALWTAGQLRHVIAALDGAPVAVTVDTGTGHTVLGAQLRGVLGYDSQRLIVDHGTHRTNYLLFNIGMILPLVARQHGSDAKWVALESYRKETNAAITQAQAAHPDLTWGRWSAHATARSGEVQVSYSPIATGSVPADVNPGRSWYGVIHVAAQEAAAV